MPYLRATGGTNLYFSTWGEGYPLLLIHGGNIGSDIWEFQVPFLVESGYQCILYDQHGFGRSDCPPNGYDFETLANDLHLLTEHVGLHEFSTITYSLGGAVLARYLARFGAAKVREAILVATITPFLLKTDDNPDGIDRETGYEPYWIGMKRDRAQLFRDCLDPLFNPVSAETPVSDGVKDWALQAALRSSLMPMLEIYRTSSETDFRHDMKAFTVPTLLIHGDSDVFAPIANTAARTHKLIPSSQLKVYPGASHGLFFTHQERLNRDIVNFVGTEAQHSTRGCDQEPR